MKKYVAALFAGAARSFTIAAARSLVVTGAAVVGLAGLSSPARGTMIV